MQVETVINHYNITDVDEKLAVCLMSIYLRETYKRLPRYLLYPEISWTQDPRHLNLFKHCHKAVKFLKDKLKPTEYRRYVIAQIAIIWKYQQEEGWYNPNILYGEIAWQRWNKFQKLLSNPKSAIEVLGMTTEELQRHINDYNLKIDAGKQKYLSEIKKQ